MNHRVVRIVLMPLLVDLATGRWCDWVGHTIQIIPSFLPTLLNAAIASSRSSREWAALS